jgi:hypothetical protein
MYFHSAGDPSPQTDEDVMKWLEGYSEEAHNLYHCYRGMELSPSRKRWSYVFLKP